MVGFRIYPTEKGREGPIKMRTGEKDFTIRGLVNGNEKELARFGTEEEARKIMKDIEDLVSKGTYRLFDFGNP